MRRVYIWADLESVSDDKLDFLAVENRVLFYSPSLAPSVKRNMIRNSIYWYMKLGTRQAMEEMIDTVFGNENTSVEEWFTYAGEPFHFRIAVGTEVTQTSIKEFLKYLNQVKNARSRFDYMVFQNGIKLVFKQISEFQSFVYTFCGEFECGTYPNTEVGFLPSEVNITLEGASDVTPRAGVWIEIRSRRNTVRLSAVTPRAGVWIEMEIDWKQQTGKYSHSPCGSVD